MRGTETNDKDKINQIVNIDQRLIIEILQAMIKKGGNDQNKDNLNEVLCKFKQKEDITMIDKQIKDQKMKDTFYSLRTEFYNYRESFKKMINKAQFKKYQELILQIDQFLLGIQIKIKQQKIDSSYSIELIKASSINKWGRQFVDEWHKEKKNIDKEKKEYKSKQKQKEIKIKQQEKKGQKEIEKKIIKNKQLKIMKQKELKKQKIEVITVIKPLLYIENKKKIEIFNRYLLQRKLFGLNSSSQAVASYIYVKLDTFMRVMIGKIIITAGLRNKKQTNCPWVGNQFKYYCKDSPFIKNINPVIQSYQNKIIKLSHINKLEIYSELRVKEERQEQSLLKELQKRRETDKKIDKKIWDYLLENREAQKNVLWTEAEEKEDQRLNIEIRDVRYELQNHRWLSKCQILFSSYHV